MLLTKYEHACFTLEKDSQLLVIDPGVFTTDLGIPKNIIAIVITHEHPDHFNLDTLHTLIGNNPNAHIYAHEAITKQLEDITSYTTVAAGEVTILDQFKLEFFGGEHATIHTSLEPVANLGVMVNDSLYYPGDSLTLPQKSVEWLALPVSAPWLKLSESIDFTNSIQPKHIFPTHDAIASDAGKGLVDRLVPELTGINYQRLIEPIRIDG